MFAEASVFRTPNEVHFGPGVVAQIGAVARKYGQKALVVTGAGSATKSGALDAVVESFALSGIDVVVFNKVGREPTVALVQEAITVARRERCELFVGLGGGSPIDAAKCAAGLFHSELSVAEHFRNDVDLPDKALPWLAVPTTAGAGAEVTPNAVLTDEETNVKKSLRSWRWLAKAAFVDPTFTITCPPTVTAYSGMDAFVQAVESYTSRWATPLTRGISLEAAVRVAKGLPRAFSKGDDLEARASVAWGATMAGIALANARLGAVHGFAHPIGTFCDVPHGLACAVLLPPVIEYNLDVSERQYAELAYAIGIAHRDASTAKAARNFLAFVRELNDAVGVPASLGEIGLQKDMIDDIVLQTLPSGSLAANPKVADKDDLQAILLSQLR